MADTRDFLLEEIQHLLKDVDEFLSLTLKKEKLKKETVAKKDLLAQQVVGIISKVDRTLPKDEPEEYADVEIEEPVESGPGDDCGDLYEDTAIPDSPNKNVMSQGSDNVIEDEPEPPEAYERDENGDPYGDMKIGPIAASDLSKPTMEGVLEKRRKEGQIGLQQWQRRYCVIKENVFYYFKNRNDKQQKNVILLNGYEARPNPDFDKKHKKRDFIFEVVCPAKRSFQFIASSNDEMKAWIRAISVASTVVPSVDTSVKSFPETPAPEPIEEDFDETYDDVDTYQKTKLPSPPPAEIPQDDSGELYDDTDINASFPEIVDTDEVYEDLSEPQPEIAQSPRSPPPRHGALPEIPQPHIPTQPTMKLPAVPISPRPKPEPPRPVAEEPRPALPRRPHEDKPPPTPDTKAPPTVPLPSTPTLPEPWEEDYENIYMGMWDCSPDDENELGFKRGDLVHIISKEYDSFSWWVGEKNRQIGLVPKAYLTVAYCL